MKRRRFLQSSLLLPALLTAQNKHRIDRSRISAISDEIAQSPEEAIAFAHHFGLEWLELRNTPALPGEGKPYFFMPEDEAKRQAKIFRDAGLRISFLNTNLLKKGLPGTVRAEGKPMPAASETEWNDRFMNLEKCIRAAHAFECPYLRVFTFLRVENPASLHDRIANVLGEMGAKTQKDGLLLLVENEPACNIGDSAELAQILRVVPEKVLGCNWDPRNALSTGEVPFPDGYRLLPPQRIKNVQIKGKDLLDPQQPINWTPIFAALDVDGYSGQIGLETHYSDGTNLERAHQAMDKIVNLADASRS